MDQDQEQENQETPDPGHQETATEATSTETATPDTGKSQDQPQAPLEDLPPPAKVAKSALLNGKTDKDGAANSKPEEHHKEKDDHVSHDELTDEEDIPYIGGKTTPGKPVTIQMLMEAKIIVPCEGAMSLDYQGQKFVADLLPDGKIKSHESETIFPSPSAWALHCKRIINPDQKKSGCGWSAVRYKGKKLEYHKMVYLKKIQTQTQRDSTPTDEDEVENEVEKEPEPPPVRVVVKHNTVPNRMIQHDANTLVEAVSFTTIGKVQPFLISIGTNACFVLDLHCHLTMSEVCGYLAGSWDINTHNLAITHAFPCLTCKGDTKPKVLIESQIYLAMEKMGLTLVGWYHSHPVNAAMPSLRDCDNQLEYQVRKRGPSDLTYSPCIGIICSPYNPESPVLESSLTCYWVLPPPEQRPNEYPKPFHMQYSVVHDSHMTQHAMEQITKSIKYYASDIDNKAIKFLEPYKPDITYLDKLKSTLAAKFPREQSDGILWNFIKDALGCPSEGDDKMDLDALLAVSQPIPIPKSQPSVIPNIPSVSTLQQMVSMPAGMPPMPLSTNSYASLSSGKYDLSSHLNIPIPPTSKSGSSKSSSSSSLGLPSGLDVLTSMTMGLGAATSLPLGLTSSSYDALTANSLLAGLTPGISTSLAASLTGSSSLASAYSSLLSGKGSDKSSSSLSNPSLAASLATTMNPNLMLSSADIANVLFQGGKFPGANSLLGIPDPMSQSILDANNMYLSPSLMKMQDTLNLLKPLSTSNPLLGKSAVDPSLYMKSTQDLMKSAKEFLPPDVNISAMKSSKHDYSSESKQPDVSISTVHKPPKISDYAADFSLTPPKSGESFLNQMLELTKKAGKADFSKESMPSPAKIPKTESYSGLNLSSSAVNLSATSSIAEISSEAIQPEEQSNTIEDTVEPENCEPEVQDMSMNDSQNVEQCELKTPSELTA